MRNKELENHIGQNVEHGAFDPPSKSALRQKESIELEYIKNAYNSNNRFEYYSEAQRN